MMEYKYNGELYKEFTKDEAYEWGMKNYNHWLINLQDQENMPKTPVEKFFRYYTQGIHYSFNRILRYGDIETYVFDNNVLSKDMFIEGVDEIRKNVITENIVVHRYVSKNILRDMKKWGNISGGPIRKGKILLDKGFMSTTLALSSVRGRDYATPFDHSLLTIYVPKGTPGVYVDLISDMHENEMLFAPGLKLKVISSFFGRRIVCVVVNDV